MPCYNDGQYIHEAIDSIKKQTYTNIEIIVIDDGSDDEDTCRILDKLSDEICVLKSEHLRPAGARNLGISKATGKYILPVDADDRIDSTYVEKCVNILEENDNIGAVYCYADLFGEKSGPWYLPKYSFRTMLIDNIVFVTAMFRKEDWERLADLIQIWIVVWKIMLFGSRYWHWEKRYIKFQKHFFTIESKKNQGQLNF